MAETKVIMPQMGESIFEGTLTKWLKKKGERVERDEPLFEISTDKIDTEIPSPAAGVLQDILVNEGQTVQINTVVAVIGDGSAKAAAEEAKQPAKQEPPAKEAPKETPKQEPKEVKGPAPVAGPTAETEEEEREPSATEERIKSSPLVRRIAKEHNVDLSALTGKGTGIDGRVTKSDILSYIEQSKAAPRPAPAEAGAYKGPEPPRPKPSAPAVQPVTFTGEVERVPLTQMRKAIAEHMVMSRKTSAHVTTFFEVDCSRILHAKEKLQPDFERSGARLTVTAFFVQAAANALKRFPIVNSSLEGDTILYKRAINIGIAVNLEWGLIVPVIKNADEKNLLGLAKAINDIGERARNKKLTPDDIKDGTFTITNPGQYGAVIGTPIINQPQVAIMGMGGIKKRAVVIDDAIAIRPMIMLSLSFDHRVIDGATADQFMADVQKQLESWAS
ncbi:MAG: 2-oxoglutarate dehydrogenase, E2 component, dihydrolipoamide succinyltransferase [Acidobacteria bacterium]|nr:MAG: 2-oxoglutarate dehydrogenase, E2 component, dihydrolipoamide succinyltransferase [Acidobacteriota bacterium]